jgi:hypothetical protein
MSEETFWCEKLSRALASGASVIGRFHFDRRDLSAGDQLGLVPTVDRSRDCAVIRAADRSTQHRSSVIALPFMVNMLS